MKRTLALAVSLTLVLVSAAGAELSQKGDLFIRFDGGISPTSLPRKTLAPISVRIEGKIKVLSGETPPALRKIKIALNRGGQIDTAGLARCKRGQIELATTPQALAACAPALIGSGGIVARTDVGGLPNALVRGELLLFNSRDQGRPAILAHVFQRDPAPFTRLVVFHMSQSKGNFGTTITGTLPPSLNRNGYMISIFLSLQRLFSAHGERHSYLSASCAAPAGFSAAPFPFAKVAMTFDDGRTLTSTMTRTCRVRGR